MKRRGFIQTMAAFTGLAGWIASCRPAARLRGNIRGASARVGHLLRDKKFTPPAAAVSKDVVIIGAGISGLSAAYHLHKGGVHDFVVLDLEEKAGGNAAHGSNAVSAYPWGAHYIPLPNNDLADYLDFLVEAGVITGFNEQGLPHYNELFLCFDPEERLYINGQWQEGLVPNFGVPEEERRQIEDFLARMDACRHKKGTDNKDAFALPVEASSTDEEFVRLDRLTMKNWLAQQGYSSNHLHWYVDYCTRDDFGTGYDAVSAWAGIHYFACRKGRAANAGHHDVLTWPEGNGWLVGQLEKTIGSRIQAKSLVTSVSKKGDDLVVSYFDVASNTLKAIRAKQVVLAVPQFIAARLLNDQARIKEVEQHLHYVPWMVANLTVGHLEERGGATPAWDNVIYNSPSLGYIDATHQLLDQHKPKRNLTYYLPLTETEVRTARKGAQERTWQEWAAMVFKDLERIHPNIEEATEELNVQLWGHAMAQPRPGLIHGTARAQLAMSLNNKIHFAHTDLAGVSLFEEGFYQGLKAAQKVKAGLA